MLSINFFHRLGNIFGSSRKWKDFCCRLNYIINGCHIHPDLALPKSTGFVHGGIGTVINRSVKLGENVLIYQNVTLGAKKTGGGTPVIEDNVTIYANSVIVGDITIGKGATISAMSFVNKSVPENQTWGGVPARKIK